jgi:signal transduction histidine kinase
MRSSSTSSLDSRARILFDGTLLRTAVSAADLLYREPGEDDMSAPMPGNEGERLEALTSYRILDTAAEGEFDHYARMVAQLCGTEIGAMTLIDRERQWIKAVHGPLARNIPRDHAFCPHTILQTDVLEVPDARLDPRFAQSTLVTGDPHVRFYAGVALVTRSGAALGTLCVFDSHPGGLSPAQRRVMVLAAAHIGAQLELRRAVLQLVEQKKIASECRVALNDTNRRQQELTAMLVHDFKSPLTAVSLNAGFLVEDGSLTPPQQGAAQEIVEASQALSGMVNDLLDVSRAEDGRLTLHPSQGLNLYELARECVESSHKVAQARRQQVEVVGRTAPLIDGDRKLLCRVISNLVDNAYKYAPEGSRIHVEVTGESGCAVLRVIDEGRGIPREQRLAVFEKYVQLDTQADRPSHGLGLAFCRLAIEAHRGTIEIEDDSAHCVFRVALPTPLG